MPAATAPLLDPRTIIVMASVMSLLTAAVMFSLRRIDPLKGQRSHDAD